MNDVNDDPDLFKRVISVMKNGYMIMTLIDKSAVSMGSMLRIQEIIGVGEPMAVQDNRALRPISTTFVVGDWVITGKPTGTLSAVTINQI
ncbi:hypothetical protein PV327_008087 [Microctonus hyperodae]|uniref:Uncharacterized protein n=1 Tax=Microctonus hyperodae TaxID=165561 RepID=A0AA39F2D9_MICHY|nr:hypothetical protein PV327_008087 [Microctonus hyperodae]